MPLKLFNGMDRLSITSKFTVRNLSRNHRRTLLSALGVAIGCSIALIDIGLSKGKVEMLIRNVAEGGTGHIKVAADNWIIGRNDQLRLADWQKVLGQLRGNPEVKVATPRVKIQGMLAMGTRLSGVEITGVDPQNEPKALRYVRQMESGRYLQTGDRHAMVLGRSIADHLGVATGDQVEATVVDPLGAMKSDMFDVVGIVNLGTKQMDQLICQTTMEDVEDLSGIPGAGEITVILKDADKADSVRGWIQSQLPAGDKAWTWAEVSPQSQEAVQMNAVMAGLITVLLVSVAFLGVASAQLTAMLERRKELAILSALGMGSRSVVKLALSEAFALGTISLALILALAGPITYYFAKVGLPLAGQSMTAVGTVIDPVMYGSFGLWFFTDAAFLAYASTFLASLYPAWFAVRLDPAEALRTAL